MVLFLFNPAAALDAKTCNAGVEIWGFRASPAGGDGKGGRGGGRRTRLPIRSCSASVWIVRFSGSDRVL